MLPPLIQSLSKITNIALKKHILISLYRILKVGEDIQELCKMEMNPYLVSFLEEGGDDRVRTCLAIDNADIQKICIHILKKCENYEQSADLFLPNILSVCFNNQAIHPVNHFSSSTLS